MYQFPINKFMRSAWSARMLRGSLYFVTAALVGSLLCGASGKETSVRSVFETPVQSSSLDQSHFAEWVDGKETTVSLKEQSVIWTADDNSPHFWPPLSYGSSRTPGVRYVRVPFKEAIRTGSILVRGGGQLSVLKPTAAYPGNLNDDSEWITAMRVENGQVDSWESHDKDISLWVLPSALSTRALRFKHTAAASDPSYSGWLGGIYVLADRFANLAPQSSPTSRTNLQKAGLLVDGISNGWSVWDNDHTKKISEAPEWITLTWRSAITLRGLAIIFPGFTSADAQFLKTNGDWETVRTIANLKSLYPAQLEVRWIDFGRSVTSRAVRLRITATFSANEVHDHLKDKMDAGKRVWLDELLALQPLGDTDLRRAIDVPLQTKVEPVALKFTMPEEGYVTLVVDDTDGKRVRNLVSDTFFPKGQNTVYWDGTDDLGRDLQAAAHGIYSIPAHLVNPGTYLLRGLWHKKIDLLYEMSVYSAGNPPWETIDGTGGWTTNHTPPSSVLFVSAERSPIGKSVVYIGSHIGEGGAALAWVDLNGNKLGGRRWVGGNWTGAQYLTSIGAHVYAGSYFEGENRLTEVTSSGERIISKFPSKGMGGLAAQEGVLIVSETLDNQLVFVDVLTGKILKTVPLAKPRGVAVDPQGRLLLLSGTQLLRDGTVLAELDDPVGITLDTSQNIYVSDRGRSHQVKVFSPDGHLFRTYGVAGVPKAGTYEERHMNNPAGVTVDSNGRLWVAEEDFQPKRVSVWNPDGSLWRAFYGPPQYGGGGSLDSHNANRFSYNGMEFQLDWQTGQSKLKRVFFRLDEANVKLLKGSGPPETALYFNGRRYMTNAFNSDPTAGSKTAILFLDEGETVIPLTTMHATGGVTVGEDGSFYFAREGKRFKPVSFASDGVPTYDRAGELLATGTQPPASSGGDQVLTGTNGWTFFTTPPKPFSSSSLGGVKNGAPMWSYPSLWPGLHASHSSPIPDRRGMLVGTTRLLGEPVTPKMSTTGPLFFINGNQGNVYVMTQDGLFVSQLFQDVRQGKLWQMPIAQHEMLVNDLTLHDENFFPTVTQGPDGNIYLMVGATPALVKVGGLESLRSIMPIPFNVTTEDIRNCLELVNEREAERQSSEDPQILSIPLLSQEPTLNNQLRDWSEAQWVPIDKRGVAAYFDANTKPYDVEAAAAIANHKLFVAWKTGDPHLLQNSGEYEELLFKTGGALDLMVSSSAESILRLLVTRVNGHTKALIYRGWPQGQPQPKPIDVSSRIELATDGQGNYQVNVPLELVGLNTLTRGGVRGDVGILRGDGRQTVGRVYWHNKATAIVSDVASEAALTPNLWGSWQFGK